MSTALSRDSQLPIRNDRYIHTAKSVGPGSAARAPDLALTDQLTCRSPDEALSVIVMGCGGSV